MQMKQLMKAQQKKANPKKAAVNLSLKIQVCKKSFKHIIMKDPLLAKTYAITTMNLISACDNKGPLKRLEKNHAELRLNNNKEAKTDLLLMYQQ